MSDDMKLVPGYRRMQGIVTRRDDQRFEALETPSQIVETAMSNPACIMVNRNSGSGTRLFIDGLLGGQQPAGYAVQTKSHNAVATSVAQGRADWGVAIDTVARLYGLSFMPIQEEHYDFVIPASRWDNAGVQQFVALLHEPRIQAGLRDLGFEPSGG